jgi:uncharacterized OB-fold protein
MLTTVHMAATRPIAEHLFTETADGPRLIGSRCTACGTVVFPVAPSCARCGSDSLEDHLLARRGTLFTFTTQGFLPKAPYTGPETEEDFAGFTVGYVEIPGEVMVESRLTESDPAKLAIGMEMELVVVPFRTDADGAEVTMFAFSPLQGGASARERNTRSEQSG